MECRPQYLVQLVPLAMFRVSPRHFARVRVKLVGNVLQVPPLLRLRHVQVRFFALVEFGASTGIST
jgi:hypothetical protein